MNQKNAKLINDSIYSSILSYRNQDVDSKIYDNYNSILEIHKDKFFDNFYGFFNKFGAFLDAVDLNHAELPMFLNKKLNLNFYTKLKEINCLYQHCIKNQFSLIQDFSLFGKTLIDNTKEDFVANVGNPEITKIYTRFLPENNKWIARKFKKKQSIEKKNNLNNNMFDELKFDMFYHGSKLYQEYKNNLENKKQNMEKIGCSSMAKELDNAVNATKELIVDERFGFQRITISKLVKLASKDIDIVSIYVDPIVNALSLKKTDAFRFIEICENFPLGDKTCSIFDHYARIDMSGSEISFLIGEIDTKSYFICNICEG